MREHRLLSVLALLPILASLEACNWNPGSLSGPSESLTGTWSGPYSYTNNLGGPNVISGTLSFVVAQNDLSEIRNIQLEMHGCQSASVQVESILIPLQSSQPPGRGNGWFTIPVSLGNNRQLAINCEWHDQTMCGISTTFPCGQFGGSARDYGFLMSKQEAP